MRRRFVLPPRGRRWDRETFDPADMLYIEENPYADFSLSAWDGGSVFSGYEDLFAWLNTSYPSSAMQCLELEALYDSCLDLVSMPRAP